MDQALISIANQPSPRRRDPQDRDERLRECVRSAQLHLLSLQAEDGHWCGELEGDTILESEYILTKLFLGRLEEPKVRKAANYLRSKMRPQGGWAIYPGGPADVSASVKAYFVLKLLGDNPDSEPMRRTREIVLEAGGLDACNSFTKIYLAIFGQYPWSRCPSVPPELILLPRSLYVNIYAMSSWSRAIIVPLSIISAKKPRCPVPATAAIPELMAPGIRVAPRSALSAFYRTLNGAVNAAEIFHVRSARRAALARAERWILERLEGSDGLGAI